MIDIKMLNEKAIKIRIDLLNMIYESKTGHTGGSLSCSDILVALFYGVIKHDPSKPKWEERDRFVLSKGHSVEGYYCILADLGYFPKDELKTYSKFGSKYIGHPNNKIPGIEMNTGSLGHGLSISVGMALASKMQGFKYRVYTLMGDGEQAEGSVWEAAMSAAHYKLDNLVAIVDRNKLQISGCTENVMALDCLEEKWKSFGWEVLSVDGHDIARLVDAFSKVPFVSGKPTLIMANTIKGKGVSFMENTAHWHHGVPTAEQLEQALKELSAGKRGDCLE